jgi:hypothetical protein
MTTLWCITVETLDIVWRHIRKISGWVMRDRSNVTGWLRVRWKGDSPKSKPLLINHFFHPSNRGKLFNESDSPSVFNTLSFPRYQDIPWYILPYDTIFPPRIFPPLRFTIYIYIFFFFIVSFTVSLIYESLSTLWFPCYYAERSCEYFINSHGRELRGISLWGDWRASQLLRQQISS